MLKILPTLFLSACGSAPQAFAFLVPTSVTVGRPLSNSNEPLRDDGPTNASTDCLGDPQTQRRRDFLTQLLRASSFISTSSIASSFPFIVNADENISQGDLTSQLFNSDGSLRDPNTVVEAKDRTLSLPLSVPTLSDEISASIITDGVQVFSPDTTNAAPNVNLKASYKIPMKWNVNATNQPLYYDSSEGKNGVSCDRITVYAISKPNNLDMSILEKASRVGVATSLFMDKIQNKYFDQGILKADLISGRTTRKPIKILDEGGEVEFDEQIYYEFDLAFAPEECPDFGEGNEENLGLGFCPYDRIFLISATVLKNPATEKGGTLICCVLECNKKEWKMGNSDLKRVRSSFSVDR